MLPLSTKRKDKAWWTVDYDNESYIVSRWDIMNFWLMNTMNICRTVALISVPQDIYQILDKWTNYTCCHDRDFDSDKLHRHLFQSDSQPLSQLISASTSTSRDVVLSKRSISNFYLRSLNLSVKWIILA